MIKTTRTNKYGINVLSICVEDVWFRYSGTKNYILEEFSFKKIEPGTIGILGTNGCGKSTFLKLIGGIYSPSLGKIRMNEKKLNERKKTERIIYVPENARLFLIGPTPKKDLNRIIQDPNQVDKLLDEHQFTHLANKKLYNLSEGQRRLVAIFNAFQIPSSIIILDEPTIGLDAKGRELLFYLFEQAKRQGKIVFVASNDPRIFPKLGELVIIRNGRLFQRGLPKDILYNLEESSELIPNQIPRLIRSLELQLERKLPRCLTAAELNLNLKNGRFL